MGFKPIGIGHCICLGLGQCGYLHIILYNDFLSVPVSVSVSVSVDIPLIKLRNVQVYIHSEYSPKDYIWESDRAAMLHPHSKSILIVNINLKISEFLSYSCFGYRLLCGTFTRFSSGYIFRFVQHSTI